MKKKKKKIISPHIFVAMIALILALTILSRALPDGTMRLSVGDSGIGEKAIALTFDDGPCGNTEELLDGLAEYVRKQCATPQRCARYLASVGLTRSAKGRILVTPMC